LSLAEVVLAIDHGHFDEGLEEILAAAHNRKREKRGRRKKS